MSHSYQIGDYQETYRSFRQKAPERFNWTFEVFDRWGRDPNKVAMVWVSHDGLPREITFRQFTERSERVSNALTGLGAGPGDRVFTMLPRVAEWWEIMLGCFRARLVPVPGTTLLTTKDIEYRLNAAEVTIAVTDADGLDKIEAVRSDCPSLQHVLVVGEGGRQPRYDDAVMAASDDMANPHNLSSDPLLVYFTSGTTGYPKMVINTHSSYPIGLKPTGEYWLDNRPTDLHWTLSDTGWAQAAWTCFFAPWNMGAAIFIWDHRRRFDPELTLRMMEDYPITTFFAPPTAYRMLVQEDLPDFKPKALRHCVAAGEAVNPEVIDAWHLWTGHHLYEGYGQTETALLVGNFPCVEYRPGSKGVEAPGYHVAVVDDDGHNLPPGQEGEIAVRTRPERPVGLLRATGATPTPTPTASAAIGTIQGTRPLATRTDTSSSSGGPTTSSSALPTASDPSRSSRPSSSTTPSLRPRLWASPTSSEARSSRHSSCLHPAGARRDHWSATSRNTCASPRLPTSTLARSSSWRSCPRRLAARSAGRS